MKLYIAAFNPEKQCRDVIQFGTVFLTVSLGVLSTGRLTPPGVKVGLKDTERFPDTDAAAGTTRFCTGGRLESILIKGKIENIGHVCKKSCQDC